MKNVRAILFLMVLILGLPLVAGAQQVDTVNPNGIDSFWGDDWWPAPSVESLNDWPDADGDSVAGIIEPSGGLTVDLDDPTGGPYTAIKVKLMTYSFGDTSVVVRLKGAGIDDEWSQNISAGGFTEYSSDVPEWTGLNMSAAELADLQVEMEMYPMDMLQIAAIQVELVSESTEPPVEAAFSAVPTSGEAPLHVEFTDESIGATSWLWDFGDGNTSTEQDPYHIFEAGTWTVTLTVSGSASDTATKQITVTPAYTPVLEARTRSFRSHRYGKRLYVSLRVKNVSDHKVHTFKVAMYSADNPDAPMGDWELLKERTFHKKRKRKKRTRCLLRPNRARLISLKHRSADSLSGKYLFVVVKALMDDQVEGYSASAEVVDDMVKILVP